MVSIDSKGDRIEESCAGRSFHNIRNKNKDIDFVVGSVW